MFRLPSLLIAAVLTTLIFVSPVVAGSESEAPARQSGYSIESFLRDPTFRTMRISPDGTHIAATVPLSGGKTILVVLNRETMERTALLAMAGSDNVEDFAWVSDQRLVVTP